MAAHIPNTIGGQQRSDPIHRRHQPHPIQIHRHHYRQESIAQEPEHNLVHHHLHRRPHRRLRQR